MGNQLAEYYADRAGEYDEVYRKPERRSDIARLRGLLPPMVNGRRVLEIAAGTGYWTQVIARSAASVTATDLNLGTLAIAATRDYAGADIRLQTADAYQLADVPGDFDAVFCGFWWSHVLRSDISHFLAGITQRASPGATLVLVDNRYVPGSSHAIRRTGPGGDTCQRRALSDGREYEVLKNFPTRARLIADLDPWATSIRYTELEYYWLASCELAVPA